MPHEIEEKEEVRFTYRFKTNKKYFTMEGFNYKKLS